VDTKLMPFIRKIDGRICGNAEDNSSMTKTYIRIKFELKLCT